MAGKKSKTHALLAAGAGVAVVGFQGVFMSGCGSVSACTEKSPDGGYINVCEQQDAAPDAEDATTDAAKDAASDAPTDANKDAGSDAAPSDASGDAPTDAPAG